MNTGRVGVAISTTGDEHRLGFLETCVKMWDRALPAGASLFVTVDGDADDCARVRKAVHEWTGSVYRVGQRALDPRHHPDMWYAPETGQRLGVAVNKNTGIELLMDQTKAEHLFLSDDDTWPLYSQSLDKHMDYRHSMVMWGQSRLDYVQSGYAAWTWPRGVMLYTHRSVIEKVGGMVEAFGPGGHEHVEWSKRIHNAGFTEEPFLSPASYATRTGKGAGALWHAEDMRRQGEPVVDFVRRKRDLTSVRRTSEDWDQINRTMTEYAGSAAFVPYRAHENGRTSATLCADN